MCPTPAQPRGYPILMSPLTSMLLRLNAGWTTAMDPQNIGIADLVGQTGFIK
jgi:hypothetical protein